MATNRIETLDPALIRPGRLSLPLKIIYFCTVCLNIEITFLAQLRIVYDEEKILTIWICVMHLLFRKICVEPHWPFSSRAPLMIPVNLLLPFFFFKQKILGFPQGPKNKIKM